MGTFGLVVFGAQYKGSTNLLVTRNITDTNVTMAYFILLWPFALLHVKRYRRPVLATILLILLFLSIVMLSFSRGAVLIVVPYLIISLAISEGIKRFMWVTAAVCGLIPASGNIAGLVNEELSYSWHLRFEELHTAGTVLQKLRETSGRADIHRLAFKLFLESPLFGHGTASFEILGPGYREAHSLFFTILAEQGILGLTYMYALFLGMGYYLLKSVRSGGKNRLLPLAFSAYLLFVHSVGSVFVIIPSKSLTINCIAPILLMCLYYHAQNAAPENING